jgi:hypothetical protein
MRLLFVADGRSPTALSWLNHWIKTGHQVNLVSTYPCESIMGLASFHIIPVAFSGMGRRQDKRRAGQINTGGSFGRFRNLLRQLRYILGPLTLPTHQRQFRALVHEIRPDLVHALRIPFEGMLASTTPNGVPLVISIWGNDITLHARGSSLMARFTRRTLHRANGLLADTNRDIRLGYDWGFGTNLPVLIVPGSGGIHLNEINTASNPGILLEELPDVPIVVNPRGLRPGSLRQDIFFQSIPLVMRKFPQALFICPTLIGDRESEHWIESLGIRPNTKLWPHLDKAQMWVLFKKSRIYVSPSIHDGTPNSLLEAMACGCFPVVGNIESMKEWITSGKNGLLVDATSPRDLADGIVAALENPALCGTAKIINAHIIAERAAYKHCMAMTEMFYQELYEGKP